MFYINDLIIREFVSSILDIVTGSSTFSILSSEGTTTATVSTPPSSSSPSSHGGTSRGSSVAALTPSISPAPSTSSLATSSTASSSNLVLHNLGHGQGHYQSSRLPSSATGLPGGVGLRALRDRGDLVFRAPAVSAAVGVRRRVNPNSEADHGQSR